MSESGPSLDQIRTARAALGDRIRTTPTWAWRGREIRALVGPRISPVLKLELFQYAGSFKPRGALMNMLALDGPALARGVTAVSAGNHAMAVGYAAQVLGTTAHVVMPDNANAARVAGCEAYGAQIGLVPDVHRAFDEVKRIESEEGRTFVHPFEGERTVLGTATLGLELARSAPDLGAVIVPIGGGGLCAGVACAIKQALPDCLVFGVEPEGADTMHRSFASGKPETLDRVRTIADSLGAPHTAPFSLAVCRRYVDDLVLVNDDEICAAMALLFRSAKIAVEPAAAAATAALLGPLKTRLQGRTVGLIICGSNIDRMTFGRYLARGETQ